MLGAIGRHLDHHRRFYAALLAGLALGGALARSDPELGLVVAGDGFFATFLAAELIFVFRISIEGLRERASVNDEGIGVVVVITLIAILVSLESIFSILNQRQSPDPVLLSFAVASVPLGWFTFHTVAAFRYAHLYYGRDGTAGSSRGLEFPGEEEPTASDFLYFAFVIGMTAQVSDVQVRTARIRRLVLAHSLVSFFFNTVILALAVNMAVVLRG